MSDIRLIEGLIEGDYQPDAARYGIACARFNGFIVERLLEGALDSLRLQGVPENRLTVVQVPGAYELPLAVQKMAATRQYDAIIALGAVIRGDTPHFEYVATACASGLSRVSLAADLPVIFGVLTVDTIEQAVARAATTVGNQSSHQVGNKGAEAALSAMEMVSLSRRLLES